MNKAMLTVGIILLALVTFALINIVQDYSTGNELDYYLIKETTDGAMTDAVDYAYYTESGNIRIDKEVFVESFIRRFANSVTQSKNYHIRFYDINETPPKVSVQVDSSTAVTFKSETLDISTRLSSIIETNYQNDTLSENWIQENKLTGKTTAKTK